MTTQLNLDAAALSAAQQIAATSGRSLDAVVSDLVLKGLRVEAPAWASKVEVVERDGFAVATLVPAAPPIDVEAVRRAVEDPDA
ncbi:MAG: hypothetical protein ACRCT8_06895 [Lacipirellulaceae bacterium]